MAYVWALLLLALGLFMLLRPAGWCRLVQAWRAGEGVPSRWQLRLTRATGALCAAAALLGAALYALGPR